MYYAIFDFWYLIYHPVVKKMYNHEYYMRLALKLARRGLGSVEPNPAVGCVIVKGGKIIGTGYHKKFGGPHAEINALADCRRQGNSPAGATVYVTLEPCCHYGKTGPCTEALTAAKVAKVIIAMKDPAAHVNGKGIAELRRAKIKTETGICKNQAEELNRPFVKFAATKKPWVILKWAQSLDGFISRSDGVQWISSEQSRLDANNLRKRCQGVLVGIETVLADDPLLTARPADYRLRTRIVLDSRLRIPLNCKLLETLYYGRVVVFTCTKNTKKNEKLKLKGATVIQVPQKKGWCDLKAVLKKLGNLGIQQLLVEGGAKVLSSFVSEKLFDEIVIYISPVLLGKKGKARPEFPSLQKLCNVRIKTIGDNIKLQGFNN